VKDDKLAIDEAAKIVLAEIHLLPKRRFKVIQFVISRFVLF
jgi:hypothetical protein